MLQFPYLDEPLHGTPPPTLPSSATVRRRPLVPVSIMAPGGKSFSFGRTLVDPGADETIFPLDIAHRLAIPLLPASGHAMRWRGQRHPLRYGEVELELADGVAATLRWPAIVAFSAATIRYPLLGMCGCLEFLNVRFLGADHRLEIEPNTSFPAKSSP